MISISNFQSVEQAKNYYQKENYYQKNSEQGFFHGKAFSQLNLDNLSEQEVLKEEYELLLQGINPATNQKMTYSKSRAGFDVTFSAPKSLSVLIEFLEATGAEADAKALRQAHELATQATMKEIEDKYLYTRIKDPATKELIKIKAAGAMYASFQHDTARKSQSDKIDPQLHTHNFIFNTVTYTDPFTQELKTATIENFEVFKNKLFLGLLYRKQLANNLKKLGLDLEVTDSKNGFFELKDFNKDLLEEFSNRSKEIKEVLEQIKEEETITNEAALKNEINKQIKQAKAKVDREALYEENLKRLENILSKENFITYIKSIIKENKLDKKEKEELAKEAIGKAAAIITEYNSTFSKEELLKEALKLTLTTDIDKKDLEQALKENENILGLDNNVYSTLEIIKAEKYVIQNINNEKEAIFEDKEKINEFIDKKYNTMTEEQKAMLENILTLDKQYILVQGDAGAGKTYSLKALNEFLGRERKDIELIGLSFTGKAAKGLEQDSGIKSKTLSSFIKLSSKEQTTNKKEKILVVDEAGLVGSKQFAELMQLAEEKNYKVVFIGDTKQFSAIQAGNIFKEAQNYSNNVIELTTSLRQKDEVLKDLVKNLKYKNFEKVENLLEQNNLIKEEKTEEAINDIVKEYFEKNEDLLIIASKNKDKNLLNEIIRSKKSNLKNNQNIKTNEMMSFTDTSKFHSNSYLNTKIQFLSSKKTFDKRIFYKVIDKKDDYTLIIEDNKKNKRELNLLEYANDIMAFREAEKEFAVGDKIIFTKNDNKLNVKNGEIATILKIENNKIYLDNKKVINTRKYNYIDYAYAITDYKSQGVTANNVAILADTDIATYNSFYTQITRAKFSAKIYTQNKELLLNKIEEESKKRSAVSYLNKVKEELEKEETEIKHIKEKESINNKNNKNKFNKGVSDEKSRINTKTNTGKNITESSRNNAAVERYKRENRSIRKERFRFKKSIYRIAKRFVSLLQSNRRNQVIKKAAAENER